MSKRLSRRFPHIGSHATRSMVFSHETKISWRGSPAGDWWVNGILIFAFGWMHDEGSGSETLGLRRFSSLANQKAACHRAKNPPKIGSQFVAKSRRGRNNESRELDLLFQPSLQNPSLPSPHSLAFIAVLRLAIFLISSVSFCRRRLLNLLDPNLPTSWNRPLSESSSARACSCPLFRLLITHQPLSRQHGSHFSLTCEPSATGWGGSREGFSHRNTTSQLDCFRLAGIVPLRH